MASSLDRQQLGPQMSAPKRHANHPDRYDHPPMPHHLSQDPYQNGPGYPPGPSYPSRVDPGRPPVGMHHHRPPSPPPMSHRDPRAGMDPPGPNAPPLPGMMGMPPDDRYAMPPYHRPSPGPHPPSPSWQNQQLYQGPPPPGASSLPPHLHQPAYNNVPPQHRGSPHMPLPPPHHAAGPPLPPHNVAGGPGSAISESHAKLLASPASASRKSPKPSAAMAKNASTETSVSKRGAAKAEKAAAAAAANASNANSTAVGASQAAHDANAPAATESKKDKKRKEVIDRIHRIHFETIENRESLYQELYHALTSSYATLLSNPARSRHYTLELTRLTLQRDAALRETALLHAHQLESARLAYENEKHKVDEEARLAKRGAREKLLAVVEATKKRLQEEKEGGDVAVDAFFDSAQRPHTTRKLRNKASAKRGAAGGAPNDDDSDAPGSVARGVNGHNGVSALGIASGLQELIALSGFGRDEVGGGGGRLGLSSALDLGGLGLTFGGGGDLLSGAGMGDSSYMGGGGRNLSVIGGANGTIGGVVTRTSPTAGSRWDAGKSLNQLTPAKDFEIESDLINIRKTNGKRARRK
ncbi:hypothetical protein [Sporisorium scitamineum]|uniref:Centrosomal protein ATPase n=1 Tax=Sporisorium scitamineum TaxID=49012 RepID=A0A0F7S9X0_9BASI|nr:hypothetical protein [Sporisorium scitamineum]